MTIYQTTIRTEVIELGLGIYGEVMIGNSYQVAATDKDGNRFVKYYGDDELVFGDNDGCEFEYIERNVEAKYQASHDAIMLCATSVDVDQDDWFRADSVYGSKAYEQRNEESDYLAFEQQQERERF